MDEKSLIKKLNAVHFSNVISLGFFCSVAGDLERLGLRSFSGPFDWVWSTWTGVFGAMKVGFKDFFNQENFEQAKQDSCIYADRKYDIVTFHDFSKYRSFDSQYFDVKSKYQRRIHYFYEHIKEPTLFVRYVWNGEYKGKKCEEIKQIEKDYDEFLKLIKSYNMKNEVIFIVNDDVSSDILPLFHVEKDEGDVVARHPCFKNENLKRYFEEMNLEGKKDNLKKYHEKMRKNQNIIWRAVSKIKIISSKRFLKEYKYEKQYDHGEYRC